MSANIRILLIDDDDNGREALGRLLEGSGFTVVTAACGLDALAIMEHDLFNLIISDLFLPDKNGIEILQSARRTAPSSEVIVVTGYASAETAVRAMKEGAFDYITKPVNYEELRLIIGKVLEKQQLLSENVYLKEQLQGRVGFSNIIGGSPAMKKVFERMSRIVKTDSTILVTGESGTGKEMVARALHFSGARKDKPFVAVNCGAIPDTLLESELFGHVRGAFTGAIKDKPGKFEAANQGTLFLDEIGTMPQLLQTKLLRVLQEQEVERIGSNTPVKLDVRVISASNSDLEQQVKQGLFREDLFYRLNVIPLHLPPLRERTQDIMTLVSHFLGKFCRTMGHNPMHISKHALDALEQYSWPGNVRELENLAERLVALAEGDIIRYEDLPSGITGQGYTPGDISLELTGQGMDLDRTMADIERTLIRQAMTLSGGVKQRAADLLQINRTTLLQKIKRLGM